MASQPTPDAVRMAKVDDLLERRAKQVGLAIVARLAHRSPPTANLAVEGIIIPVFRFAFVVTI
jgi:hypothetical protein